MALMQFNESFWVALSIILFGIFISRYISKPLRELFVSRAEFISNKLKEAALLKQEANELLKESLESFNDASNVAENLLNLAEQEIICMKKAAERDLLDKLNAKKHSILNKIHANEAKFLTGIRMQAVQLSIESSLEALSKDDIEKVNSKLIKNSMKAVSTNFN